MLRLEAYRTGGGQAGNVARGQVRVLKTSIPYVARVENRVAGDRRRRGRDAGRRQGARPAAAPLARPGGDRRGLRGAGPRRRAGRGAGPLRARGGRRPRASGCWSCRTWPATRSAGSERADLDPPWQTLERISNSLDERRLVGTRLLVQPPDYLWLTAVVSLSARPRFDPGEVRTEVLRALYRLYHPLYGGPDGTGWPFGRSVQSHEVHAALARIPGVDMSREVRVALFPAEADTGRRGAASSGWICPTPGWSTPSTTRSGSPDDFWACGFAHGRAPPFLSSSRARTTEKRVVLA